MMRYWKLGLLIPLIVVCMGIYYVEAAGNIYPEYVLKTVRGNVSEASPIFLAGQSGRLALTINTEGSKYRNQQSLWESLAQTNYGSIEFDKLLKEYPQFMRGKRGLIGFYQDERTIKYVDLKSQFSASGEFDYRFNVSEYDKNSKISSSFELKIPKENEYGLISLFEVQNRDRTMKIVTFNNKKSASNSANFSYREVHLYTLDLNNKKIVDDQVISSDTSNENQRVDIRAVYHNGDETLQKRFIIFEKTYFKQAKKGEDSVKDHMELFVYDMESGKEEEIQDEAILLLLKGLDKLEVSQSGNELILLSRTGVNGPGVIRYNLVEKKITKEFTISLKELKAEGATINSTRIANNRLYMLINSKEGISAAVVDLDTGGILYQGIVSRKDNQQTYGLEIYNISIH
jgi:hypothetical protein